MSDSGGGGGALTGGAVEDKTGGDRLAAGVTQRSTRSRASSHHSRNRHRATPAKVLLKNIHFIYFLNRFHKIKSISCRFHGLELEDSKTSAWPYNS